MPRKNTRNTRGRIISAAWKLFYENGYEETTIEDILFESGTSRGSFYHYFEGKDALLGTLAYVFDEKYEELTVKIQKSKDSIELLQNNVSNQKDVGKRMTSLKKALADGDILDEFDRVVFESIVDKVIVGETNEDGTVDPYKLTFVMKGNGNSVVPNAKEWFKAEKSAIQPA